MITSETIRRYQIIYNTLRIHNAEMGHTWGLEIEGDEDIIELFLHFATNWLQIQKTLYDTRGIFAGRDYKYFIQGHCSNWLFIECFGLNDEEDTNGLLFQMKYAIMKRIKELMESE